MLIVCPKCFYVLRAAWMYERTHKSGFTLIELLVVISIIALLLSILMPSLQKVKEQARGVVCGSNVKNIGMGFMLYASDYNDHIPAITCYNEYPYIYWYSLLWPYGLDSGWNPNNPDEYNIMGWRPKKGTIWSCPSAKKDQDSNFMPRSYGISIWLSYLRPNLKYYWGGRHPDGGFPRLSELSNWVLVAEYESVQQGWWEVDLNVIHNPVLDDNIIQRRHADSANYIYSDGHVERNKKDPTVIGNVPGTWPLGEIDRNR